MTRLDWELAKRPAKGGKAVKLDRSGPITDKQRSYIKTLQSRTGSSEPMPPSRLGATHLIDSLKARV